MALEKGTVMFDFSDKAIASFGEEYDKKAEANGRRLAVKFAKIYLGRRWWKGVVYDLAKAIHLSPEKQRIKLERRICLRADYYSLLWWRENLKEKILQSDSLTLASFEREILTILEEYCSQIISKDSQYRLSFGATIHLYTLGYDDHVCITIQASK